jgi:hypothetical protein
MDLAAENIEIGIVMRTVMRLVEMELDKHGDCCCKCDRCRSRDPISPGLEATT